MTPRSIILGDMLDALLQDLLLGAVSVVRTRDPFNKNFSTGPWQGLKDVTIRYDCVTFHSGGKSIEARISRLPAKQADQVREVWLSVDPDNEGVEALWRTVLGANRG